MKTKSIRLAAVAAVLLAFCLVFMAPVGAEVTHLNGAGTADNPYQIGTVEELTFFRDSVNKGETQYNADSVYVALNDDIDMDGVDWSVNIGDGDGNYAFSGIFDGRDFTISNLNIKETAQKNHVYICTGLFGMIESSANIKNLVIENVDISTEDFTGNCVGAVVGISFGKSASIENVEVCGDININAPNAYGVGCIVGYSYYDSLTIVNCHVNANPDSTIKAVGLGGIVGYSSGTHTVSGCSVNGLTFSDKLVAEGRGLIGGIYGIVAGSTEVNDCAVTNVDLTVTGDNWQNSAAIVVGTLATKKITVSDITYENVKVNGEDTDRIVGSHYAEQPATPVPAVEACVGDVYYCNFADAFADAESGDTITLQSDVTLTETLTIPAGKTITLDLNGKTISMTDSSGATSAMIKNEGDLTITDNGENGKLSFTTTTPSSDNAYASNTISNYGTMIVESGIIENKGTGGACYAIDNYHGSTATINGGTITAAKTVVRVFDWTNSKTVATSLTISGGSITSEDGYGVNFNMGNAPGVSFTITGGTITTGDTDYQLAVYIASKGSAENIQIRIDDGEFNGAFAINGQTQNTINSENIAITGGTFNGGSSVDSVVGYGDTEIKFISGGTFANDVSAYVAEDHICISKDETSFEVIEKPAAAVIPETVPGVESGSDNYGNSIIEAPTDNVNDKTGDGGFVEISSTEEEVSVSFVITGATVTGGNDGNKVITLGEDAEITANYDVQPVSDGTSNVGTFQLSIKIDNVTKPLPVIDATVDETIMEGHDTPVKSVLAMITALGADRNSNLASGDGNKITITFSIPVSAIENLNNLAAYHVDKDGKKTKAEMGKPVKSGNEYRIKIHGKSFSSYVLVEEEPQKSSGSAVDTGSGNYQYYPREVTADGIIDFGTSKVVTGIELPVGSTGTVTLNIKPDFAMPENGYYAFEIDAPGYNLDAKINGGLSFQIPVADLEAAGWTAEDIVLFHGTVAEDGKIVWEALPTNLVKNENGVAYYKAAINGCSPFYIGFVKDGSVVNTEVVDPVTPETPVTPDEPEVLPPVDEPETPEQPTESPAPILAVLAGLGAAAVLRRK